MKKNKKNISVYFLEMLIVFIIIDLLMTIVASLVGSSSLLYKYGDDLVMEIFYSIAVLIVMLLFKNSYVFTEKKENFIDGVLIAIPMLIVSVFNFGSSILNIGSFNIASFINMVVFCVFVGIAEEFLCRGWLQNEFIERFSTNKKETIISIILSSLIFGFMHIVNISFQTPFETILQIINATSLGFLLGSVYYKTKNIWSVIFLHSFYDFSIMLGEVDLIKDCTYNNPSLFVSIYESFGIILISVLWILGAIYVLNKCKFNDSKKESNDNLIITFMVVIFIVMIIPIDRFIPDYDNYRVCYSYREINDFNEYTIHYPKKKSYNIFYEKNDFSNSDELIEIDYNFSIYKNKKGNVVIENKNTSYEKEFVFKDIVDFEVFESNEAFNIAILTSENESTIYFSNSIIKNRITDDNSFIDEIVFNSYVFPEIKSIGYIDDNDNNYYFYALSENNDRFVIINKELFVIK